MTTRDPLVEVATALSDTDDTTAFRYGLELLDRLRELAADEFEDVVSRPPSVTSGRYAALLAACVDLVCCERDVDTPAWCDGPNAVPAWWVSPLPSTKRVRGSVRRRPTAVMG